MSEHDEFVGAQPKAKRLALGLAVAGIAMGAAILYDTRYLARLTVLARTDRDAAMYAFNTRIMPQLVAMAIAGAAGGAWMVREGIRAWRAERYPQPDSWVIQDTRVRRGQQARVIGVWLIVGGLAFALPPVLMLVLVLTLLGQGG